MLGQFLEKKGIIFTQNRQEKINQAIVLEALLSWLDLETNYFEDILKNTSLTQLEKISAIKRKVTSDFKYLHYPPTWFQAPD